MEFITSAILGGAIWDFIKFKAEPTIDNIRSTVGKLVNIDEAIESALSKELLKLKANESASIEELTALLDSSLPIQSLLTQINQAPQNGVTIQNFGSGDAFNGDKVMGDKIITK